MAATKGRSESALPTKKKQSAPAPLKLRNSCEACANSKSNSVLKAMAEKSGGGDTSDAKLDSNPGVETHRPPRPHRHRSHSGQNATSTPARSSSSCSPNPLGPSSSMHLDDYSFFPPALDLFPGMDAAFSSASTDTEPDLEELLGIPPLPVNLPDLSVLEDFTTTPMQASSGASAVEVNLMSPFITTPSDDTTMFELLNLSNPKLTPIPPATNSVAQLADIRVRASRAECRQSTCECHVKTPNLMKDLSADDVTGGMTANPLVSVDTVRSVVDRNETVAEEIGTVLKCPCEKDGYLLSILSLTVFKMLALYAAISRKKPCSDMDVDFDADSSGSSVPPPLTRQSSAASSSIIENYCLDGDDSSRMMTQLVLSKLHRIGRLTDQLSSKLQAVTVQHKPGQAGLNIDQDVVSSLIFRVMDIPSRRSQPDLRRHGNPHRRLQRRESNGSSASYVSEIEFATAEPFSGVAAESVPTSTTGFAYRGHRQRRGSISSFTYFQDDDEPAEYPDDEAIVDLSDAEDDELHRRSAASDVQEHGDGGSFSQKLYIEAEDLTMVIAGFTTSSVGVLLYTLICVATAGIGYLVFRWMPRWRVRLVGVPVPLRKCGWVVVEVRHQASRRHRKTKTKAKTKTGQNQWGEFSVHYLTIEEYGHAMSTVFNTLDREKHNGYRYAADPELKLLRFLDYRYMRLIYHPTEDKFVPNNDWWDPQWTGVKALRAGLDSEERERRSQVFGKNAIEVEEKSIGQLLVDEAFHPFYIFQIASLLLWSMDEYYYYAAAIFLISVFSITTTIIETRSTMRRLREISKFECDVRVLRNGFWRMSASTELVPGDVFEVSDPGLTQLPCDSLLLAGDCIVNESMLTGESIPVSKLPLTDEMLTYVDLGATSIHPVVARHFLFCGTKIIRARRPHDTDDDEAVALAMVVRTGFNTTKGALVRSMLFPKPAGFKFYRDSFRYIAVMACIALVGFIASFVTFIRLGLAWHLIIVRALDLITIVVPPALPATLTIGTNFALGRLRKDQIFCISPQRVNVAGKLDVVCFDKTGTLTEDGLDVLGVRLVQHPEIRFGELLDEHQEVLPSAKYDRDPTMDYRVNKTMLYAMATCHSLRLVDEELIGDPLDLKMFQFTGWSFEEASPATAHLAEPGSHQMPLAVARPPPGMEWEIDEQAEGYESRLRVELAVVKSFEFGSHLRRASVVVRQSLDPGVTVYVKGAPEVMRDICMASSIPSDFDDLLSFYTHKGFRVIACASKYISRLDGHEVEQMERAEAETSLQLTGFIVFENKLKEVTTDVIEELNQARIRNIMCTGDNILTAISVARQCDLLDRDAHCFVPHFVRGDKMDPMAQLSWESVDNKSPYELDEHTLLPMAIGPEHGSSTGRLPFDNSLGAAADYSLAVTGDAFRWMIDFGSTELLQRMLVKGQVFARMSPDEKHELVEKLQALDYTCGFCGDGANDCGALKAADVGVSLSEAEASVAAPFTSHVFDISCVPRLIKEGRAALVTSFCCFKYMSLYSAIQFTTVSFLYASASNLGDFQFLFIDLALILPIAIFMGWTGAYPELSTKRPTASLVSRKVLTPLLGQIGLCVLVQLVVFETVQRQPWYQPPRLDREKSSIDNSQNTALFLVSCFQYSLSGVVLSVGPPFRQPMVTNAPFCVTLVIALAISLYLLLDPAVAVKRFMDLTDMSLDYEGFLLAVALLGFGVAYTAERHLFPIVAKKLARHKQRKRYKVIGEEMAL
ncbi:hypothetical protein DV738_g928, partial [Chaetothyriales sp. CBS 135597]